MSKFDKKVALITNAKSSTGEAIKRGFSRCHESRNCHYIASKPAGISRLLMKLTLTVFLS